MDRSIVVACINLAGSPSLSSLFLLFEWAVIQKHQTPHPRRDICPPRDKHRFENFQLLVSCFCLFRHLERDHNSTKPRRVFAHDRVEKESFGSSLPSEVSTYFSRKYKVQLVYICPSETPRPSRRLALTARSATGIGLGCSPSPAGLFCPSAARRSAGPSTIARMARLPAVSRSKPWGSSSRCGGNRIAAEASMKVGLPSCACENDCMAAFSANLQICIT